MEIISNLFLIHDPIPVERDVTKALAELKDPLLKLIGYTATGHCASFSISNKTFCISKVFPAFTGPVIMLSCGVESKTLFIHFISLILLNTLSEEKQLDLYPETITYLTI